MTASADSFGRLTRHYRRALGLSRETLAERALVSVSIIRDIEAGIPRARRREIVEGLAAALELEDAERVAYEAAAYERLPAGAQSAPSSVHAAAPVSAPSPDHAGAALPTVPPARPVPTLPLALTRLIGREEDVVAVADELADQQTRLLTLTGPAGVGKTRLALAAAEQAQDAFPNGLYLVELAPLATPDLVDAAIAHTLGILESGQASLHDALLAFLREKRLLLILDNFEHVLAAAALVAEILTHAPGVTVLATSRVPLGLRGEREREVRPLTLPGPAHSPPPPDVLMQFSAVALFLERAQAAGRAVALTPENAAVVAEICRRLDGLPLAIELVAPRLKLLLTPAAVLKRLDRSLPLLSSEAADRPLRLRTMRNAIQWSYDLLAPTEQALFRRLAIFAGGCTFETAEAVCAGPDVPPEMLQGLASLTNNSLLRPREQADGEPRFELLETIREFGWDCLRERGELEPLRARHAMVFLALAEGAEPLLHGPNQVAWLERLAQEHDNLRAALEWTLESGQIEQGLRLATALGRFWELRGHLSEGRTWLDRLLALPDPAVTSLTRTRALLAVAILAQRQGDYHCVWALATESLALSRASDDRKGIADALYCLGYVAHEQGQTAQALALQEESLALRREVGDPSAIAASLNGLGLIARDHGEYERAAALHAESLALRRELGDVSGMASALHNAGLVAQEQGHHAQATALFEECVALSRALGDRQFVAAALNSLGDLAAGQGQYAQATALFEECLAVARELGARWDSAIVLLNLGAVTRAQGQLARASALLLDSLAQFQALDWKVGLAYALEGLALVAVAEGRMERAGRLGGAAAAARLAIAAPLPPVERAAFDDAMAAARQALGAGAWTTAWAAGQALTLDQAIAAARE